VTSWASMQTSQIKDLFGPLVEFDTHGEMGTNASIAKKADCLGSRLMANGDCMIKKRHMYAKNTKELDNVF